MPDLPHPDVRDALPTKARWDWSTAGQESSPEKDADGRHLRQDKGDFTWTKDIVPAYFWYNGTVAAFWPVIRSTRPRSCSSAVPVGEKADPKSKIAPFKYFTGKQPYDKKNDYFVTPKLFGKEAPAYWAAYDWNKASRRG